MAENLSGAHQHYLTPSALPLFEAYCNFGFAGLLPQINVDIYRFTSGQGLDECDNSAYSHR